MNETHPNNLLPMNDFFGWDRHPFADTYPLRKRWMPTDNRKKLDTLKRLVYNGKSTAVCGPSGSGKTSLIHMLISDMDKGAYRPILLPYAGYPRNGFARILADTLGVETKGRGVPLIARIQQYLENMAGSTNPRHPVILVDDAQHLETDSFWDLCSLIFQTAKQTIAASIILSGDENLLRRLDMYAMLPIRSRLTGIIKLGPMNDAETRQFLKNRLLNAGAPEDLFDADAMDMIAAYAQGNRRAVMNTATQALEEAFYFQEKTVTADRLYASEWFNESE